jgi:murein DD-endopeptidase MepM/ murein hydrolase activator NlpD
MKKTCILLSFLLLALGFYSGAGLMKANADTPFSDNEPVVITDQGNGSSLETATLDAKESKNDNDGKFIAVDPGVQDIENWLKYGNATDTKDVATGTKDVATGTKDVASGTKDVASGTKDVASGTKDVASDTKKVEEPKTTEYTVVPGDYLSKIAQEKLGDYSRWPEIVQLNKDKYPSLLSNPDLIYSGWVLTLPGGSSSSSSSGSNSSGTSSNGSSDVQANGKATDSSGWGSATPTSPMPSYISSEYGPRNLYGTFHYGIDIPVCTGTRVNSMANGTVTAVGYEPGGGNYVKVKYDNGYETFYCHLQNATVKVGQRVKAGEQVAVSDNTGQYTTGAHLHMEVRINGNRVDPRTVYNGFPPKS